MAAEPGGGKDREICKMLGTSVSELEGLLGKSRQTIAKRIERDQLFGVDEILHIASKKIPDDTQRSRVVSKAVKEYFPNVLKYTKDLNVERFSQYYVLGMDIHSEIVANLAFERFLATILADTQKFLLFACAPVKPYVQLGAWLRRFEAEKGQGNTASFILIPCKLVELTPIQVLADPWSNDPQLIQFGQDDVFVDIASSGRASSLAAAVKAYGPSARTLATADLRLVPGNADSDHTHRTAKRLMEEFNSSVYQEVELPEKPFLSGGSFSP